MRKDVIDCGVCQLILLFAINSIFRAWRVLESNKHMHKKICAIIIISILSMLICIAGVIFFVEKRNNNLWLQTAEISDKQLADIVSPVPPSKDVAIVAVGDVMLGRFVETLMNRYGTNYPFEKISDTLKNSDAVIGNLEGTIISDHTQTPLSSLTFSFLPVVADTLSKNNFTVLSLANNHSYNFYKSGFLETRKYLENSNITPVGSPYEISSDYVATKFINGRKIVFIGFNTTFNNFSYEDADNLLSGIKKNNPDAFIVVMVHWGEEYSLTENETQQYLAHNLIDNGADVIFGAHPHVVEGIEKYNGKIIFYSLGNFIFDQYFSEDTKEGLMVQVKLSGSETDYKLIPLRSEMSQPQITNEETSKKWLGDLSLRSDVSLKDEILKGEIIENNFAVNVE